MPEVSITDSALSSDRETGDEREEAVVEAQTAPVHPRRFYANLADL